MYRADKLYKRWLILESMERHHIFFAVIAIILSAAFAQQITDAATQTTSQSPFDNYCYNKCIILANDTRCEKLCLSDSEGFNSFCSETCMEKSGNANLCTMGCALLMKKRTDMKSCFDSCSASDSEAACDNGCNITSTVKMIMATVGLATSGSVTEGKVAVIERRIADLFPNSTIAKALGRELIVKEGGMNFTEVDGKKYIRLPVGLENNEKLDFLTDKLNNITIVNDTVYIPIRSKLGQTVSSIVAETDGIRGKDGIGEGEIKTLQLRTQETTIDARGNIREFPATASVSIDADLNEIPTDPSVDISSTDVPTETMQKFNDTAKASGRFIRGIAMAVEVTTENLADNKEVGGAKIKVKVDSGWLSSVGGISGVRLMRGNVNQYELLNTTVLRTEAGNTVLEGDSPNGLSLYALVTVGVTAPTGDTGKVTVSPGLGGGINPMLIGAILLIVVAAVYLFVLKKK